MIEPGLQSTGITLLYSHCTFGAHVRCTSDVHYMCISLVVQCTSDVHYTCIVLDVQLCDVPDMCITRTLLYSNCTFCSHVRCTSNVHYTCFSLVVQCPSDVLYTCIVLDVQSFDVPDMCITRTFYIFFIH